MINSLYGKKKNVAHMGLTSYMGIGIYGISWDCKNHYTGWPVNRDGYNSL